MHDITVFLVERRMKKQLKGHVAVGRDREASESGRDIVSLAIMTSDFQGRGTSGRSCFRARAGAHPFSLHVLETSSADSSFRPVGRSPGGTFTQLQSYSPSSLVLLGCSRRAMNTGRKQVTASSSCRLCLTEGVQYSTSCPLSPNRVYHLHRPSPASPTQNRCFPSESIIGLPAHDLSSSSPV